MKEPRHLVILAPASEPAAAARRHAADYGLEVLRVYRLALNGYAARVPTARLEALRRDPEVRGVVVERVVVAAGAPPTR